MKKAINLLYWLLVWIFNFFDYIVQEAPARITVQARMKGYSYIAQIWRSILKGLLEILKITY